MSTKRYSCGCVIVTVDTVTGIICTDCGYLLFQSHELVLNHAENSCMHVIGLNEYMNCYISNDKKLQDTIMFVKGTCM